MLRSQKHRGTEELHTRTACGRRRGDGDGERQTLGETLPSLLHHSVLAAKALLGHIGAGRVHGKILSRVLEGSETGSMRIKDK